MTSTKKVPPLELDTGNVTENWTRWREIMELILAGPQADKWTDKQKAAQFLIIIGQKGRDVCRAMIQSEILTAADKEKPERLFEEFDKYCKPKTNKTVQRTDCKFHDSKDTTFSM